MSDKRSTEQMDSLRERLYSRGESPREHERTSIQTMPVSDMRPKTAPAPIEPQPPLPPEDMPETLVDTGDAPRRGRSYRKILIATGVAFFALSVLVSSVYMVLGKNTVSGSNIALNVSGPFTLGGGDTLDLQVGIANQNSVTIESATLIVVYPAGTRAADDSGKELFTERIPLDSSIAPGESRNISLKSRVFGEENQEAEVKVSIEYRVKGSSATLVKEAVPHRFKISHAPVTLKLEAEKTISSGQETTVKLTVTSNSPTPMTNLMVKAEYPSGFDFSRSTPAPVSGRNVWRIDELQPEASATIDITGVIVGTKADKYVLKFSVGAAGDRNPNDIASLLAVGDTEFTLEDPFLDLQISINNSEDSVVSITPDSQATVFIDVENTLDSIIYDGVVEVKLSGNALSNTDVLTNTGYYNSNTHTVRFDSTSASGLRRLNPGATERLSLSLQPSSSGLQTPQIVLEVSASARRISQTSAREQIAGTHQRTIKLESRPTISATLVGAASGPVPPVVGQETTYDILWKITNSANSISGAVVTAVLPSYVEWKGESGGAGAWSYNSGTRTIEWQAGNVNAGASASGTFRVSLLPSSSLVGRTPTLVEAAHMRATDNFTNSLLRQSSDDVTTELEGSRNSGVVQN
jgi:hypothetical protein